jgi:hypothetical protein
MKPKEEFLRECEKLFGERKYASVNELLDDEVLEQYSDPNLYTLKGRAVMSFRDYDNFSTTIKH